jgi:hypothetical protein
MLTNSELFDLIKEKYDKRELKILCFRLDIEYEEVEMPKKDETAIEIIKYCKRRGRLYQLVSVIEKERGFAVSQSNSTVNTSFTTSNEKFDVFLCHNSLDKPAVNHIGEQLKGKGIQVWLDEEELRPGSAWLKVLDEQIKNTKSVAVFLGKNGLGRWQDLELQAFFQEYVTRQCRIIPVILYDAPVNLEITSVLKTVHWVDFRISQPDPIQQLILGIMGN